MSSVSLESLLAKDAVLFDLDGVLTPTADVHMHAWRTMFEELFARFGVEPGYSDDDYFTHLDGKRRYDGVAAVLRSRGIDLPWGDPADDVDADTVCGIGNRKNDVFSALLEREPVTPYPGSKAVLDALLAADRRVGVVSSSKNARAVLASAGLLEKFPVVIDGAVAERDGLASKPAPDMFVAGARGLGVDPATSAAIEDAVSGVRSAAAGGFGLVIGVDRGTGDQALRDAGAHVVVGDLSELL